MADTRIDVLTERVLGLEAEIKRLKAGPKGAEPRSRNGRPSTRCFCCGGPAEIQHTGGERMTIICSDCCCQMRIPVEIIKKPDVDCLCSKGLSDTCLGLCGDKGPDGTLDPLRGMKKEK